MARLFLVTGAVAAGIAVMAGAFGAHALQSRLTPERLQTFETGVRYQMYHALALLLVGWIAAQRTAWQLDAAGYLFLGGIVLFSGSLYLLVLTDTPQLGAVAPLGGLTLIAGWFMLAWGVLRSG